MGRRRLTTVATLCCVLCAVAPAWSAPALQVGPYLQGVSPGGAVVMWETTEPVAGRVAYGTTVALPESVADLQPATMHELKLTGLSPATWYGYRVSWPGYEGKLFRFRTLPALGAAQFRIVAYGDTRTQPHVHARIAGRIQAEQPAVVLNTGDLVADGTKLEQWPPQFFAPLARLLPSVPYFTALGNHERNSPLYYQFMSLPNNEAWYSFDCGRAHIVMLDTNQPYQEGSPQYAWLERDLDSVTDPRRWIIVGFHVPMYRVHPTRGVSPNRWAWERLFERHAVDLVLNGDDHYYMRSHPIGPVRALPDATRLPRGLRYGTVHVITGGGGAPLYPVVERPYAASKKSTHHYVVLDFDGPMLQARTIDLDGNEIDRFALERGRRQPDATYFAYETMLWEKEAAASAPEFQPDAETGAVEGDGEVVAKSPFPMRVAGEIAWTVPEGNWEVVSSGSGTFSVAAGGELRLPFHAKGTWKQDEPLPTVTVRLTEAEGGLDFANREFTFAPLRMPAPPG